MAITDYADRSGWMIEVSRAARPRNQVAVTHHVHYLTSHDVSYQTNARFPWLHRIQGISAYARRYLSHARTCEREKSLSIAFLFVISCPLASRWAEILVLGFISNSCIGSTAVGYKDNFEAYCFMQSSTNCTGCRLSWLLLLLSRC